ncbi:MAG TPA: endonuclease/exonuclease/phosphatase family protein [Anaerolineae bacterium]|nr:endonuclease/exonuclease/phosphatase family protein [Anaerolineae bacterium]
MTISNCPASPQRGDGSPLRVMSFNLRYDNPADGYHGWAYRRDWAGSIVRLYAPDVLGVQEALAGQVADLAVRAPDMGWVGVGRDDGVAAGEFAAIFYRAARLSLLAKGTFWLSKTPEVPGSRNWKACCVRIVTWAKFFDQVMGRAFFMFNTHFDQASEKARRKSAQLLLSRIPDLSDTFPLIVVGDLNCDEASEPYRLLVQEQGALTLQDAKYHSLTPHHGPSATFHAFSGVQRERIDYIFVANGVQVLRHATLADHWDNQYPSDHFPVLADVFFVP